MKIPLRFVFVLCCILPLSIQGAETKAIKKASPKYKEQIKKLMAQIYTINLINGLKLTPQQIRRILPLARKARKLHREYDRQYQILLEEMEQAFSNFKKEDEKSQGFSKKVERRTALANRGYKLLRKKFTLKINQLENRVLKILNGKQKERLKAYRPSLFPRKTWSWKEQAEDLFKRVRNMPQWRWEFLKQRLVRQILRRMGNKKKAVKIQKARVLATLEKMRAMQPRVFAREKGKIIQSFRTKDKAQEIRQQMAEIRKEKYGAIGQVGKYLLHPYGAEVFAQKLKLLGASEEPKPKPKVKSGWQFTEKDQ